MQSVVSSEDYLFELIKYLGVTLHVGSIQMNVTEEKQTMHSFSKILKYSLLGEFELLIIIMQTDN